MKSNPVMEIATSLLNRRTGAGLGGGGAIRQAAGRQRPESPFPRRLVATVSAIAIGMPLLLVSVAVAAPTLAEQGSKAPAAPRIEPGERTVHGSACSLAESMAAKLGIKGKSSPEVAQRHCQSLVPSMMSAAEKAEFIRCCTARLENGPGDTPERPKPKSSNPSSER